MWICLNDAFLSVVDKQEKPGCLTVRARRQHDISRVFPQAEVIETPSADYRYRALISRDAVARALTARVIAIDYSNFKDSVSERDLHDAYFDVWSDLFKLDRRNNS